MTALALGIVAGGARADEPVSAAPAIPAEAATASSDAQLQASSPFSAATPIATDALGAQSAQTSVDVAGIVINQNNVNGVVTGNTASNNVSGNNSVSGSAFTDASGVLTVIQNSGNNVLIQDSTIINISMEP
jgi:hypothetical protein